MTPSSDIPKAAAFSRARWLIPGCVLLLFALAVAIWGLSLAKLRWDQQRLLVSALPLVSGFSAAFASSIFAQVHNWISGLAMTAILGCTVWLVIFFFLFPKQEALGQQIVSIKANNSEMTVNLKEVAPAKEVEVTVTPQNPGHPAATTLIIKTDYPVENRATYYPWAQVR